MRVIMSAAYHSVCLCVTINYVCFFVKESEEICLCLSGEVLTERLKDKNLYFRCKK